MTPHISFFEPSLSAPLVPLVLIQSIGKKQSNDNQQDSITRWAQRPRLEKCWQNLLDVPRQSLIQVVYREAPEDQNAPELERSPKATNPRSNSLLQESRRTCQEPSGHLQISRRKTSPRWPGPQRGSPKATGAKWGPGPQPLVSGPPGQAGQGKSWGPSGWLKLLVKPSRRARVSSLRAFLWI